MPKSVCLDIETMSTRAQAVVLSVGMCFFDTEVWQPYDEIVQNGIELFFCRDEQANIGRHIQPSTLEWWEKQGEDAQRVLEATNVIHPRDFYEHWNAFCERCGVHINWMNKNGKFYVRGPSFDIAILDDMFADFNVTPPWKYWQVRDVRTWLECNGLEGNAKLKKPETMVSHNALHDAAFDAFMMLEVLHKNLEELEIDVKDR